jgi:DNA-binding GntR family transcriptional regulator
MDLVPPTAQAAVADQLRAEVISGALTPGARLPQTALAHRMRTSTTPVREALRQLASEGLLDGDPHRGFSVHRPHLAELLELYELRILMEPLCAAKTAENITQEQLAEAAALVSHMEHEPDPARWAMLNRDFHQLLTGASQRPLSTSILRNLRDRSAIYAAMSLETPLGFKNSNKQHRQILHACRRRDQQMYSKAVLLHLRTTVGVYCSRIGPTIRLNGGELN